jgi:mannose-6-phosphate isomerase-like protein (cupin superfamily)
VIAPDGSEVRVLLRLAGGSMAHFQLDPGEVSIAVMHRTVEELWFVVAGRGAMWRSLDGREEVVALQPGVSLSIPVGTRFQFRAEGDAPFAAVGVTMPPWPGEGEAVTVEGAWAPTVAAPDAPAGLGEDDANAPMRKAVPDLDTHIARITDDRRHDAVDVGPPRGREAW